MNEIKDKGWDAQLYDNAQAYVSRYGVSLLNEIGGAPKDILDIACGTGDLTMQLAQRFTEARVEGSDFSAEMIAAACEKYPNLSFRVEDATCLKGPARYDTIFSNAAFHWIPADEQSRLLAGIAAALKPSGLLVAEFGALGNIAALVEAYTSACEQLCPEQPYRCPFYFPSTEEYRALLETAGFEVLTLVDYDRPTPLPHGEHGLELWMRQFFSAHLDQQPESLQAQLIAEAESRLRSRLFTSPQWIADYRRLRLTARRMDV